VFAGAFALIGGWGGQPVRSPDKLLTPFHMDIAASIQAVLEEAVVRLWLVHCSALASRSLRSNLVSLRGVPEEAA
jgi:carbamoyltransferase